MTFSSLFAIARFETCPEGHLPEGQQPSARLSEEICLSEGSAGVSQRALRGLSEGSVGSSAGLCGGPWDFPRVFGGCDPMLVTLRNCQSADEQGVFSNSGCCCKKFTAWMTADSQESEVSMTIRGVLECRKWGCNKWGFKGRLASRPGNRPKSAFFAPSLPFSPLSGGSEQHLENRENGGKRPFSSDILGFA